MSASNKQADAQQRQVESSRRQQVMELFDKATGQLSDPKSDIRLAAT